MRDPDTVLELDPKNEEAYNNRGWARKATEDIAGVQGLEDQPQLGNQEAAIILVQNNRCNEPYPRPHPRRTAPLRAAAQDQNRADCLDEERASPGASPATVRSVHRGVQA
ncbi:MAG: hypothetical protein U0U25_03800 [Flavobacteriales bacterium]